MQGAKGPKVRVRTTQGTFFVVDKDGKEREVHGFEGASTEASKCGLGFDYCEGGFVITDKTLNVKRLFVLDNGVLTSSVID